MILGDVLERTSTVNSLSRSVQEAGGFPGHCQESLPALRTER